MSNVFSGKLTQSRGWTVGIGLAAAVLAAILLVVYLNRYRTSVNETKAQTPVLVAKNLIPPTFLFVILGHCAPSNTMDASGAVMARIAMAFVISVSPGGCSRTPVVRRLTGWMQ